MNEVFGPGFASRFSSAASHACDVVTSTALTVVTKAREAAKAFSARIEKFVDDHEDGFTAYTSVFEFAAESITNTFTFSLIYGAFVSDVSWLGFPPETLYVTIPLAILISICAAIVHTYSNDHHKEGAEQPNPGPFTTAKKLLVALLLLGDFFDHTGAFAGTGILFLRFLFGALGVVLSPGLMIAIYIGILLLSGLASVSEVKSCAENMLAYYRNTTVKQQDEAVTPNFFTGFTIGFGGLMTLLNSYTIYGVTPDSMFGAKAVFGGLSIGGIISSLVAGLISAGGNIAAHAFVPMAYQDGRDGFSRDGHLNGLGKFFFGTIKWGDKSSHAGNYAASLIQIRVQFLPKELISLAAALGIDLAIIVASIIATIAETRICANNTKGYLLKFSIFRDPMRDRAFDDSDVELARSSFALTYP